MDMIDYLGLKNDKNLWENVIDTNTNNYKSKIESLDTIPVMSSKTTPNFNFKDVSNCYDNKINLIGENGEPYSVYIPKRLTTHEAYDLINNVFNKDNKMVVKDKSLINEIQTKASMYEAQVGVINTNLSSKGLLFDIETNEIKALSKDNKYVPVMKISDELKDKIFDINKDNTQDLLKAINVKDTELISVSLENKLNKIIGVDKFKIDYLGLNPDLNEETYAINYKYMNSLETISINTKSSILSALLYLNTEGKELEQNHDYLFGSDDITDREKFFVLAKVLGNKENTKSLAEKMLNDYEMHVGKEEITERELLEEELKNYKSLSMSIPIMVLAAIGNAVINGNNVSESNVKALRQYNNGTLTFKMMDTNKLNDVEDYEKYARLNRIENEILTREGDESVLLREAELATTDPSLISKLNALIIKDQNKEMSEKDYREFVKLKEELEQKEKELEERIKILKQQEEFEKLQAEHDRIIREKQLEEEKKTDKLLLGVIGILGITAALGSIEDKKAETKLDVLNNLNESVRDNRLNMIALFNKDENTLVNSNNITDSQDKVITEHTTIDFAKKIELQSAKNRMVTDLHETLQSNNGSMIASGNYELELMINAIDVDKLATMKVKEVNIKDNKIILEPKGEVMNNINKVVYETTNEQTMLYNNGALASIDRLDEEIEDLKEQSKNNVYTNEPPVLTFTR